MNKTSKKYHKLRAQLELQSMVLPAIIFLAIFAYVPIYGLMGAFREYNIITGYGNWVGLKYFEQFLTDPNLMGVLRNTLAVNFLGLIFGFPAPIILALLLWELRNIKFRKIAQTVSYLPHFLSWIIFGGIALELLSRDGAINSLLVATGILKESINFMGRGEYFYGIFTITSIIKTLGYGSILYFAAISSVDQEMYDSAAIDGCGRFKRIWFITLPSITGTIVILLIFQISAILNTGIEQVLIFQNALNAPFSETIDTYVYKIGMQQQRFSYATAVGLLKSIIAVLLLCGANYTSKRFTGKGLF